jgi:hypothetical protein
MFPGWDHRDLTADELVHAILIGAQLIAQENGTVNHAAVVREMMDYAPNR